MQTGYCSLGPKCNFAHSQSELRLPAKIEGFELPPGLELQGVLDLLDDDENDDDDEDIATGSGEHTNIGVNFDSSLGDMDVQVALDSWNRGSVDLGTDSYWSYGFNSHLGGMHLYPNPNEGCGDLDFNNTFPDWSGDWFGAGLHDYSNRFGGDYAGCDWEFSRDNVVIDQQEEWKARKSRSAHETPKMRSVRTSESTLCTLSDYIN
jgi:hypothetical protein